MKQGSTALCPDETTTEPGVHALTLPLRSLALHEEIFCLPPLHCDHEDLEAVHNNNVAEVTAEPSVSLPGRYRADADQNGCVAALRSDAR